MLPMSIDNNRYIVCAPSRTVFTDRFNTLQRLMSCSEDVSIEFSNHLVIFLPKGSDEIYISEFSFRGPRTFGK